MPYNTNIITYSYDRERNLYLRSVDGRPHIDAADDKRVSVTNVVVLYQKFRIDTKIEPGHSRPDFTTIGSGKALVFREGKVVRRPGRRTAMPIRPSCSMRRATRSRSSADGPSSRSCRSRPRSAIATNDTRGLAMVAFPAMLAAR